MQCYRVNLKSDLVQGGKLLTRNAATTLRSVVLARFPDVVGNRSWHECSKAAKGREVSAQFLGYSRIAFASGSQYKGLIRQVFSLFYWLGSIRAGRLARDARFSGSCLIALSNASGASVWRNVF